MAELFTIRTGGNGVQVETCTENGKLPSCAHVLHKTLNLVISRFRLAEHGEEMYHNLKRACRASVFLIISHCFARLSLMSP